jgi:hypothetical protein
VPAFRVARSAISATSDPLGRTGDHEAAIGAVDVVAPQASRASVALPIP